MALTRPRPRYGDPALALSDDQIETVVDLLCRGSHAAREDLTRGMSEPQISRIVRKSMRRVKQSLSIDEVEVQGEHELDNMRTSDPRVLGRIDITLQFRHQFGDEDAYVAVECKRVEAGNNRLNIRYVGEGMSRFESGQYSSGHEWGFLLAYVIALPASDVVDDIDTCVSRIYSHKAMLKAAKSHPLSLAILKSELKQGDHHVIKLMHVFVDMCSAAAEVGH